MLRDPSAVMRLEAADARARFADAAVLRLATAGGDGRPHLVPCTFALDAEGQIVIGIDNKPKASVNLRRLRNIAENPWVSLLVDHYEDDWDLLWWARADGVAAVERSGPGHAAHWDLLRSKYSQYTGPSTGTGQVLGGPVIVVQVESWSGWAASSCHPAKRLGRPF